MKKSDHRWGLLYVGCSASAWSFGGLLTRLIHTDNWTMIAWRGLVGAAGLAAVMLVRRDRGALRSVATTNVFANAGNLGDLWEFSPASGLWTWVDGPTTAGYAGDYGVKGTASFSNAPGGRQAAAPWIDAAGDLWFLGGLGVDVNGNSGYFNDLWKYTP